jgi:hypothetical protein
LRSVPGAHFPISIFQSPPMRSPLPSSAKGSQSDKFLAHGGGHLLYDAARGNDFNSGETMKRLLAAAVLLGLMPAFTMTSAPAQTQKPEVAKVSLKVGDVAPDFALLSDQWKTVKLSDYRGKKNVLLAIYVLAFTGG